MRPVVSKHIPLSALYDGTYDLAQIAELNEALDIAAENEWRAGEAMRAKHGLDR